MDNKGNRYVYGIPTEDTALLLESYHTVVEQANLLVYDINLVSNEIHMDGHWNYEQSNIHEIFENVGYINNKSFYMNYMNINKIHVEDRVKYKKFIRGHRQLVAEDNIVYRRQNKQGAYLWVKNSRKNYYDGNSKLIRVIGTEQDITAEMQCYSSNFYNVGVDYLTSIMNRSKFEQCVLELLEKELSEKYAIIVFDIDNFKVINDIYGSSEGDRLLSHIGQALIRQMDSFSLYCRLYADHYAILLPYQEESDIINCIKKLEKDIVAYPIRLQGLLSFGICLWDNMNHSIGSLCDYAGLAKKNIKGNVMNLYSFYDENIRTKVLYDQRIEHDMMEGLDKGQFEMYLQPKISLGTLKVVGAEALVRWNHPKLGLIYPDKFIPIFERNGFIINMDYYIWERAFSTIAHWRKNRNIIVPISVNVSRQHIFDNKLVGYIKTLADKYDIPASMIELELTETIYFDNLERLSSIIQELRQLGFILSIDDFGSGYTSLNLLKDTPIDVIKFDKNFVQEVLTSERGKTVVQFIIAMAKELDIKVIAEGIEVIEQAEFMKESGCDIAQGYLYSKPLKLEEFENYTCTHI